MAVFQTNLFIPTNGSTTQTEPVGLTPASGYQDLRLRSLGLGVAAPGANGGVSTTSTITAASGTVNHVALSPTFSASGATTTARVLYLNPTINYTGGSSGSYTGVMLDAVETSLPSGTSYLIRARAGAAGTTDIWNISNTGVALFVSNHSTSGSVQFCNNATTNGVPFFHVAALPYTNASAPRGLCQLTDTTTGGAQGVGSAIFFGLDSNTANYCFAAGAIRSWKENSTLNNCATSLVFSTHNAATNAYAATDQARLDSAGIFGLVSTGVWGFTATAATAALDTGFSRISAGVVGVGNGTAADASGGISVATYQTGVHASSTGTTSIDTTATFWPCNTTTAGFTITLPTPVGITGRTYIIKKTSADGNTLTIGTAAGNIDGAATVAFTTQYTSYTVISDGSNWHIV